MIYLVNEIFETIQGEANFTGTPSIFIRMQGCPVGCGWCDTKHTWYTEHSNQAHVSEILSKRIDSQKYAQFSPDDILDAIKDMSSRHIVITGGEPCLYDLNNITEALIYKGYTVQIETSGTHVVNAHPDTWITVSPKVGMDGGFKVLKSVMDLANEIKFPVGKPSDISLLLQVLDMTDNQCDIWLQPLSQSAKATKVCVNEATANGWKVSIQTHKYMGVR